MLMNLNSLATIGCLRPRKLLLVVLDNQAYASTGGQPTFTDRLDLAEAAAVEGPGFVRMKTSPENAQVPYLTEAPAVLRHTFEGYLREGLAF